MGLELAFSESIIDSIRVGLVIIDRSTNVAACNSIAGRLLGVDKQAALGQSLGELIPDLAVRDPITAGVLDLQCRAHAGKGSILAHSTSIIHEDAILGATIVLQDTSQLEELTGKLELERNTVRELEAIFNSSFDEIYVTDGEGTTLKVNGACERLYGLKASDLVGRHVRDLERDGIFSPSVTAIALREKKRVTFLQNTKSGRRVIATANPVFDEHGKIFRVVTNSRDVTELVTLREKLVEAEELVRRYDQELQELRNEASRLPGVVFKSQSMKRIAELAKKIATVDTTVLLLGESGVGKNILAKAIHRCSGRQKGPFIEVNCGAIPEALLESELFGYESGAFTGARKEGKIGIIELANGGTLFLNEIGELPLNLQVKILQVLQDRVLVRVGGVRKVDLDLRVLAATNRDLKAMVREGEFREDLFYRLNVVSIVVPPLRERREDIPLLIQHFLEEFCRRYRLEKRISREAVEAMIRFDWPGNIRELENVVENMVVTSNRKVLIVADLPAALRGDGPEGQDYDAPTMNLRLEMSRLEKDLITRALVQGGSTYKAAEILGVSQPTIVRKIRELGIQR